MRSNNSKSLGRLVNMSAGQPVPKGITKLDVLEARASDFWVVKGKEDQYTMVFKSQEAAEAVAKAFKNDGNGDFLDAQLQTPKAEGAYFTFPVSKAFAGYIRNSPFKSRYVVCGESETVLDAVYRTRIASGEVLETPLAAVEVRTVSATHAGPQTSRPR